MQNTEAQGRSLSQAMLCIAHYQPQMRIQLHTKQAFLQRYTHKHTSKGKLVRINAQLHIDVYVFSHAQTHTKVQYSI